MKQFIFNILCLNVFLFFASTSKAQSVLSVNDYIQKIKAHHPQVKIANIAIEKAKANLLIAKGAFDPTFQTEAKQKTFDSKNYYTYNNASVKLPLPIGDIKTGVERNNGQFLESEITSGRSSYVGIEIPLAKGLLIDKRRASLKQAKIGIQLNEQEQKIIVNDLLLDAYETYYQWVVDYKLFNIYNRYVKINNERISLIKTLQKNGDRAAMDTTEAIAQLQNIFLLQEEAKLKLINSKIMLDNFIWDSIGNPQFVKDDVVPDTTVLNKTVDNLLSLMEASKIQNPILNQYKFKINILDVDRILKKQNLLPIVNLKANVLSKDYYAFKNSANAFLENNNYWGIDIKIPLRFREARGELKNAKLKIDETNWDLKQKKVEVENKLKSYYNSALLYDKQIEIANAALNNYNSLLKNEMLRFSNGESTLFLVNTRENKQLETLQKIIELQFKSIKAKVYIEWVAGVIN